MMTTMALPAKPDAASAAPFVRVENVAKRYSSRSGEAINATEQVSLDIPRGGFISLVGPSGCGKSTLLKMIGRLLAPTSGRITYQGIAHHQSRPPLGVVFQESLLLPWRTILANVELPIDVKHLDKAEGRRRAKSLLRTVGLE